MDVLVIKSQCEVHDVKKGLTASQEEVKIARTIQEEMQVAIDRMVQIARASGDVMAKAKLFDEEMHKEEKISGTRVARILANFASELEESMKYFRESAQKIEESSRKLQVEQAISLSGLSIPDTLDDLVILDRKFETPASKQKKPSKPPATKGMKATSELERIPEGGSKSRSVSGVSGEGQLTPNSGGPE
jgi:hypothetical protein